MDKFEAALTKYKENNEKISELTSLNREFKLSLPNLLNDHIATFTVIPHLKSDEFERNYQIYHQGRDIVPFYVKQFIVFGSYDKQYTLLLQHGFAIKNYHQFSKSGEIISLEQNSIHLEFDITNVYNDFDFITLSVSNVGASSRLCDETLILTSRELISTIPFIEVLQKLNVKTVDMIKSEKFNPTFIFNSSSKEKALQTLNERSEKVLSKILSKNLYPDSDDKMTDHDELVLSNISRIVLNNDLLYSTAQNVDSVIAYTNNPICKI